MMEVNDLKSVIMLGYLNDSMLSKLAKITSVTSYTSGKYIFKEGDYAEYLYSIMDGKVGLELEKTSSTLVLINTITRGMTFGFSALVDTEEKKYTSNAKALTDTKLFVWKGAELDKLFYQDYEMGYLVMRRIAKIAKTRLQIRNIQLLDIYT
jgi:CRP-like cAMP-binding protein